MTQNQLQYQKNLIELSHNKAIEEAQSKQAEASRVQANAARLQAEVAKNKLIYVDGPYYEKKSINEGLSAFGQLLRGIGSFGSFLI